MSNTDSSVNDRTSSTGLTKSLGTWEVFVAGVALVVASTTLVSDFQGYFGLGLSFAMAILLAFVINLLLGLSVAELTTDYPKAGALYEYGQDIFGGAIGKFLGIFLAFTFAGMFVFAGAGETSAGGFGLQALFNQETNLNWFIVALTVLAVIPNLLGIKTAAWVSAALLVGMLGIRWFFGIAGFLGFSDATSWSSDNLNVGGPGAFDWFGSGGLLAAGLVLGFWTFVGIEFVAPLAEEVRNPKKNMVAGIVIGLFVILGTSWLMGLGVGGTQPEAGVTWAEIALDPETAECGGSCPQLVVGEAMFGGFGRGLMALASVMATLGSMTVAFAAVPRIIYGIAREGNFFGPLSKPFAMLHPRYGTPVLATIAFAGMATIAALFSSNVTDWIFAGAYVWLLIYAAYHILVMANRVLPGGNSDRKLMGPAGWLVASVGLVTTIVGLYYAFLGAHEFFAKKAAWVIGVALLAAILAFVLPGDGDDEVEIDLRDDLDDHLAPASPHAAPQAITD